MADRLTQLQDAVNQQKHIKSVGLVIAEDECRFLKKSKESRSITISHYKEKLEVEAKPEMDALAEHFCNAVGILQQNAPPGQFVGFERTATKPPAVQNEDHAQLFAQLIARTAKDIDELINSLPSDESSADLQTASLRRLEIENQEAARRLEEVVQRGESLLSQIQLALHEVAQLQLENQALETDTLLASS